MTLLLGIGYLLIAVVLAISGLGGDTLIPGNAGIFVDGFLCCVCVLAGVERLATWEDRRW
jgi:hypothetical protein